MQIENASRCVLLLPSLDKGNDDPVVINNVSKRMAEVFVSAWTIQVGGERKLRAGDSTVPKIEFFKGNFNLKALAENAQTSDELSTALENLAVSKIPESRGRRALFVDIENDEIGVGTVVIYNENRAASGVSDPSITPTLLNLAASLDQTQAA